MDEVLLKQASAALRKAALNEESKAYILSNPVLFALLKKAADRYIGGATLEETLQKAKQQNGKGMRCSIEFMGESTRTVAEANEARDEFLRVCKVIKHENLNSSVALDLSHIGLTISKDLCLENLDLICKEASLANTYVAISAENVERTDAVLETYQRISKTSRNVAITLQAYLHRTKDDFTDMMKLDGKIVIVKGAFETPPGHSLPRGSKLDETYLSYVERLLAENHRCSIATHDAHIQIEAERLIAQYGTKKEYYEFESLFGIQNEQLENLHREGHPAKVYFVYGKEWYLYLCNRLAEHPQNVFRALGDIVG